MATDNPSTHHAVSQVEYSHIELTNSGPAASLTLARPQVLNAVSPPMIAEMRHALGQVASDTSIKALVVRGQGRAFCAGADLVAMQEAFGENASLRSYLTGFNEALFALEDLPIPTIALVHGHALAGGLELLLACDLAIAAEDARIGDQHINFGLMPGGGSTQRLPRRIGQQRAMELLFTGRWLTGQEAAAAGLVLRAVPSDELDQELDRLLADITNKSRDALGWIKAAVRRGQSLPLRDGVAQEVMSFAHYVATSSHPTEGIQAFREKRTPDFG